MLNEKKRKIANMSNEGFKDIFQETILFTRFCRMNSKKIDKFMNSGKKSNVLEKKTKF